MNNFTTITSMLGLNEKILWTRFINLTLKLMGTLNRVICQKNKSFTESLFQVQVTLLGKSLLPFKEKKIKNKHFQR